MHGVSERSLRLEGDLGPTSMALPLPVDYGRCKSSHLFFYCTRSELCIAAPMQCR